jgi:peptidyl-prolyl cis-trans isomerase B (cyclophilin B)
MMKLMLYEPDAPITTANFIKLATSQFYDGCKFHRCIDDFVAQTGDPNSKNDNPYDDGYGGSSETIPLEICENLTHVDGAVGMARSSDPNSASSQFYICDGPQHSLDGNYAVFAICIEGLDVAKKIAAAPTYGNKRPLLKDHPIDDIVMTRVTVEPGRWTGANNTTAASALPFGLTGGTASMVGAGLALGIAVVAGVLVYRWRRKKKARTADIS